MRPPEGEEPLRVMKRYRRLGFPGALGSVDCIHVNIVICAKDDNWLATTKEGIPPCLSKRLLLIPETVTIVFVPSMDPIMT